VSEEKNKTIRDEQTLAKVLEAAYVLQEHNRELRNQKADPKLTRDRLVAEHRANSPAGLPQIVPQTQTARPTAKADSATGRSTLTLAQIVEIQQLIQVRHLEVENVMSLVAERLSQFAGASGAAIGILEGKKVRYRAVAGPMALPAGTEVPLEKALCVDCLRTGNVLRCADVNSEVQLDQDECRRRGIRALLAVPVFHDGVVAGTLELYSLETRTFTEEDVHTCQLMAGLVGEALARNEKAGWKKSLATERAVMLDALEKLKPSLAAFADSPAFKSPAAIAGKPLMAESASTFVCRACGHELVGQEQFCGNCGSPRSGDYEAANMQSKIASLWHMQEARKKAPDAPSGNGTVGHQDLQTNLAEVEADERKTDSIGDELPEPVALVEPYVVAESPHHEATESGEMPEVAGTADFENAAHADLEIPRHAIAENDLEAPESAALVRTERSATWSSAATTLDFFRQLSTAKNRGAWVDFWKSRRGDIYLAIAVILFLGAVRWGMWSNHSVSATGNPAISTAHRKAAPEADLSLFDRILVKLGLAEAPDPPEYKGNPATQVWVDLQTALYYCPGADLYGKTPKGRFSSQRAARLDQFEPAYRKACD
jgi:GAF domain-containing protein